MTTKLALQVLSSPSVQTPGCVCLSNHMTHLNISIRIADIASQVFIHQMLCSIQFKMTILLIVFLPVTIFCPVS